MNNNTPQGELHNLLNEGLLAIKREDFKPMEEVFEEIEERLSL